MVLCYLSCSRCLHESGVLGISLQIYACHRWICPNPRSPLCVTRHGRSPISAGVLGILRQPTEPDPMLRQGQAFAAALAGAAGAGAAVQAHDHKRRRGGRSTPRGAEREGEREQQQREPVTVNDPRSCRRAAQQGTSGWIIRRTAGRRQTARPSLGAS